MPKKIAPRGRVKQPSRLQRGGTQAAGKVSDTGALSWEALEAALRNDKARGKGDKRAASGQSGEYLREYFGNDEFEHLRQLASQSGLVRTRRAALGNVVFLHGITGSDLGTIDASNKTKDVWVDFFQIMLGAVEELELGADGAEKPGFGHRVVPTGLNKRYYARAVLQLRAHWNVEPFAYDWRKDIDLSSDALANLITTKFPGQPVHLVAHSMGGLVSRNFIRRHPRLWDSMQSAGDGKGGRLIMLGTPNYGSFAIPQVLSGTDKMVSLLASMDVHHNLNELLSITNTFVGSYQMLPAPKMLPASLQALYRSETWGSVPGVSQRHLDRAYHFHADLESNATINPDRMVYIAGCRKPTIDGLTIVSPGEFDYSLTNAGDGRVPHALGLLKDVPTYYVDEVHGDLARNDQVLSAVEEVLANGVTSALGTQVLRAVERGAPTLRDYRTTLDRTRLESIDELASRGRALQIRQRAKTPKDIPEAQLRQAFSEEEVQFAEDAIIKAALGSDTRSSPLHAPTRQPRARAQNKVQLEVAVVQADITEFEAPIVVVGHYKGVPLVHAIGAIDRKLNNWITRACELGMFAGNLGETFYVPNVAKRLGADGVVVAGMGEFGKFTTDDLMLLMANVAIGASALGLHSFASVLIGSGAGSLSRDSALRSFVDGIADGLRRLSEESAAQYSPIQRITLVERDARIYQDLRHQLERFEQEDTLQQARIKLLPGKKPDRSKAGRRSSARGRAQSVPSGNGGSLEEVRLTVELSDGKFRFSALDQSAVMPVRDVAVNTAYATRAAERLMQSSTREEQEQFGQFLFTYLIPEDFQPLLYSGKPLRLILDRSTAGYPWEMACFSGSRRSNTLATFGTDLGVTRQFRTLLAGAPALKPPLNRSIKALVVADPAPEPQLQLPGARREGRAVANVLRAHNRADLSVQVTERIGHTECDPVEILSLLLSGQFDIVHFAGHGDFNQQYPEKSGWILGKKWLLTAAEIFRARQVPRLVFANACFSAEVREGEALAADEMSRGLASIAQAFFERGVVNYIGAGWPVDDEQATKFAQSFYGDALAGTTIGEAVRNARRSIVGYGSTWGAYQHYGSSDDRVVAELVRE